MAVTDTILGFIADIGLDAAKGRYKITLDKLQARAELTDYLARQQNICLIVLWTKKSISKDSPNTFATI